MLFLSLNSMLDNKLRKSSGDPQKSWVSLYVSSLTAGCIEGIPGHYGMFRGVPGVFRGCSGVFRVCSGVFRGVPGFTDIRFWEQNNCIQFLIF